jgi:outer membrane lipoprotein-sorting protein
MRGAVFNQRPAARPSWKHLPGASILVAELILALLYMTSTAFAEVKPAGFGRLVQEMNQAYDRVDQYTATFLIQERLAAELGPTQRLQLKFKKPFKIYLRWLTGKHEGRQALFPAGTDGNELWVRLPMLVGSVTVSLDPQSPRARKGSRHPITDVGIGRLLDFITESSSQGLQHGELTIEDGGKLVTFDRLAHRFVMHFPNDPTKGYYCMTARIDVDLERQLPIYAEIFDWDGRLIERYGYIDLRLNPGLTDQDFDAKNSDYGF